MRLVLISDIHGNLSALRAVLDTAAHTGADKIVCAGDLVGYGPHPNECVEALAELGIPCVAGNHDLIAVERLSDDRCVQLAKDSQRWTKQVLRADTRAFLEALSPRLDLGEVVVAHGALGDPQTYVVSAVQGTGQLAQLALEHRSARVLVLGHSHQQWACAEGRGTVPTTKPILLGSARHILNPGSVGQSRQWEKRPRARFALLDLDRGQTEFHAIDYDVGACRRALREQGLPRRSVHLPPGPRRVAWRVKRMIRERVGSESLP